MTFPPATFSRGNDRDMDIAAPMGKVLVGVRQRLVRVSSWLGDEAPVASVPFQLYRELQKGRGSFELA